MKFVKTTCRMTPLMLAAALALPSNLHAAPVYFEAAGNEPSQIQNVVDDFRVELGDLNPFVPENFSDGRRQINWDAAPDGISDPNAFPPDFFNGDAAPRARGVEFRGNDEAGGGDRGATGFQLSSTAASGEPVEFGFANSFQTFSPERLFAPQGGTVFDVLFFDPVDQVTPALTKGFGAVFINVVDNESVYMSFFDDAENLLAHQYVPESGAGGLSFLGLSFDESILSKVTISAGIFAIDSPFAKGSNVVAMDDFIFGEPVPVSPVPVPASLLLLLSAVLPLIFRFRRNSKVA